LRSVDSECLGRAIEPRDCHTRGQPSVWYVGGPRPTTVRPGGSGPAGVGEHGIGTGGFPRNLGRPATPPEAAWGWPQRAPWPQAGVGPERRDEDRRNRSGNGGSTRRKPAVTVRRESQRLIVPWKPGNRHRRDPGEGRGRRSTDSLEGHTAGASHPVPVSTPLQRIAERQ
jgi:hypothetical protein